MFKLGRKRPVARAPRLSLRNYLTRALPAPPASVDYTQAAAPALAQMYLNDQLGDCVIACMAHVVGVLTGNAGGLPAMFAQQDILNLYHAIGGYVPGYPQTDNGCDEQTALAYWQQNGAPAGAHQIAGFLSVDATDQTEYRTALWLFENLIFGIELPDSWTQVQGSNFTWDVAQPDPRNGHCVAGVGYDSRGVQISTWGMVGTITDRAVQSIVTPRFGGELWVVISQDAINKASGKAPNGIDWSQLVTDFDAMGGNLALPTPPAPVTPPTPPPPPIPEPPPIPVTPPAPPAPQPGGNIVTWLVTALQAVEAWAQTPEGSAVVTMLEQQGQKILQDFIASLITQKPATAAHVTAHVARKLAA